MQVGMFLKRASRIFALRTRRLARALEPGVEYVIPVWSGLVLLAAVLKVMAAPTTAASWHDAVAMSLPFLAAGVAPLAGYRIACKAFPRGAEFSQPTLRLSNLGRWSAASRREARGARLAGPIGMLVSLIAGLLFMVLFRNLQFLAIIPAVSMADEYWAKSLSLALGVNVVLVCFFYTVCFVMALRAAPLFPRMLLFTWALDIALQLASAKFMAGANMPARLVAPFIATILENVAHVLISIALWGPYLLLSDQVNLLYRRRKRSRPIS